MHTDHKNGHGKKADAAAEMALVLTQVCFRNPLENLHAGTTPSSKTGDYSDVKVVSPYGEIPWTKLSRISDVEMKALMIECVNKVFTLLSNPEFIGREPFGKNARWEAPQLVESWMKIIRGEELTEADLAGPG